MNFVEGCLKWNLEWILLIKISILKLQFYSIVKINTLLLIFSMLKKLWIIKIDNKLYDWKIKNLNVSTVTSSIINCLWKKITNLIWLFKTDLYAVGILFLELLAVPVTKILEY